ncbi:MAG: hypothetical protein ABIK43_02525 [candidate division WOR-3 bacterium]
MTITKAVSGDTVYRSSSNAGSVVPQESIEVQFSNGWLTREGTYRVTASTGLTGDLEQRNDTITRLVRVIPGPVHDAAARAILSPQGLVPPGPRSPRVLIESLGTEAEQLPTTFEVFRNQNLVFADTVTTLLPAGALDTLNFRIWMASPGAYNLRAVTRLIGDMNPANDTQTASIEVINLVHDVGVLEIIAPINTVSLGQLITPAAVVANLGDYAENFVTRF